MTKTRDVKDPMPTANNSQRSGGGNRPYPAGAEEHSQKKAVEVSASQRFDAKKPGPVQPTRQNGDGNTPVTGEMHEQRKAERVTAAQRY